jgi:hypothetical protein
MRHIDRYFFPPSARPAWFLVWVGILVPTVAVAQSGRVTLQCENVTFFVHRGLGNVENTLQGPLVVELDLIGRTGTFWDKRPGALQITSNFYRLDWHGRERLRTGETIVREWMVIERLTGRIHYSIESDRKRTFLILSGGACAPARPRF